MKFGKFLEAHRIFEWQRHYFDYKFAKQVIKRARSAESESDRAAAREEFWELIPKYAHSIDEFFQEKLQDCNLVASTLRQEVLALQNLLKEQEDTDATFVKIYHVVKQVRDYSHELNKVEDFARLNAQAFSKILKKYDKQLNVASKDETLRKLGQTHSFFFANHSMGVFIRECRRWTAITSDALQELEGSGIAVVKNKAFTIGTFDLFHRGHENLLRSMKTFANHVYVGVHDDKSYFQLKKKHPIDDLKTRMSCVKPFADVVFVIPDTDPTPYMKAAVPQVDIDEKQVCYVRGDDMPNFPAREWVEKNMPVFLVPRTPNVSSTEVRKKSYSALSDALSQIQGVEDGTPTADVVRGLDNVRMRAVPHSLQVEKQREGEDRTPTSE